MRNQNTTPMSESTAINLAKGSMNLSDVIKYGPKLCPIHYVRERFEDFEDVKSDRNKK